MISKLTSLTLQTSLYLSLALLSFSVHSAVVLQYHHVDNTTPTSTSISPELFEAHLEYIDENGYAVWPLPKLASQLKQGKEIPDKVVIISFDDAYSSVYNNAYPLLKARKMPFTAFVSTQAIEQNLKSFMTWKQLQEISKNNATIANHTHTHPHLVRQLKSEDKRAWLARVKREITTTQNLIEKHLGQAPKLLAYPYGEFTSEIEALVNEMGYVAFGQQSGAIGQGMPLTGLPRFPMTHRFGAMHQFKLKVSSLPFPAKQVSPPTRIIGAAEQNALRERLIIRFQEELSGISCFFEGKPLEIRQQGSEVNIRNMPNLPVGRSRINCTSPSKQRNRFHWFSHFWMKPHADGSWYIEH